MIETIRNAWHVPELKKKILFTIMALLIFRLGSAIPVPYIDTESLRSFIESQSGTILGLMNAMSGSAFSMATIFALSIQPYINSSIIIQLLTVAIPALERLAKEGGEEGKKKIASITRYTTVAIALLQGFGYYSLVNSYGLVDGGALNSIWVAVVIILSFTAGSAFLMWLGEQITEFGIGNGISILLFAGIVSRFPQMVMDTITGVTTWNNIRTGIISVETYTELGLSEEQAQAQFEAMQSASLPPWMITVGTRTLSRTWRSVTMCWRISRCRLRCWCISRICATGRGSRILFFTPSCSCGSMTRLPTLWALNSGSTSCSPGFPRRSRGKVLSAAASCPLLPVCSLRLTLTASPWWTRG